MSFFLLGFYGITRLPHLFQAEPNCKVEGKWEIPGKNTYHTGLSHMTQGAGTQSNGRPNDLETWTQLFKNEALLAGVVYLFLCCSPDTNRFVPQNQNLDFLCSLFPKMSFVPLFPVPLFPSFQAFVPLFPRNKCPCCHVPQTPGRASRMGLTKINRTNKWMKGQKLSARMACSFTSLLWRTFFHFWPTGASGILESLEEKMPLTLWEWMLMTNEQPHDKTNKWLCPAKTQISLGICPVWSVFTVRSMGS